MLVTRTAVAALALAAVVRGGLGGVYAVPSGSMEPALQPGDRVVVRQLWGGLVHRGDVVLFDGTGSFDPWVDRGPVVGAWRALAGRLGLPGAPPDYVKRVVGLPGERVTCCTVGGALAVDGVPLPEPYLAPGTAPSRDRFDVVVPAGRLWVMGDARDASADSRAHLGDPGGGTVPRDRVLGRVVAVAWPPGRAALLDAQDHVQGRTP